MVFTELEITFEVADQVIVLANGDRGPAGHVG